MVWSRATRRLWWARHSRSPLLARSRVWCRRIARRESIPPKCYAHRLATDDLRPATHAFRHHSHRRTADERLIMELLSPFKRRDVAVFVRRLVIDEAEA